jgi:Domain of unknown function (DUF4167)
MRQGSNTGRRPRGRTNRKQHGGGGGGGGQSRTNTFDSNGPDGRVRGNARQVYEKYLTLARDATSAGDRIAAEVYHQYAEHYFRILSDSADPQPAGRRHDDRQSRPQGGDDGAGERGDGGDAEAANGTSAAPESAHVAVDKAPVEAVDAAAPSGDAPSGGVRANGQDGDGEAAAKPRRGRPRKPRVSDDSQPAKAAGEPTKAPKGPETEDGPAAG